MKDLEFKEFREYYLRCFGYMKIDIGKRKKTSKRIIFYRIKIFYNYIFRLFWFFKNIKDFFKINLGEVE